MIRSRLSLVTSVVLVAAAGVSCRAPDPERLAVREHAMSDVRAADLAQVRGRRFYFYHHSVGVNVLAGVEALDGEVPGGRIRMTWLEEAPANVEGPVFLHGGGGQNGAPKSKIDFFAATVRDDARVKPDVAFMKLCYVDFEPDTDVAGLFAYYRRTLESLKRERPGITFAHVTVPLMQRPTDVKSTVRRLLGRQVWQDAANARRNEYNRLLRETFASDPIFDLANIESTGPDGRAITFELDGKTHASLYPGYTDDGGHLNESGRRAAGSSLIGFLADALDTQTAAAR